MSARGGLVLACALGAQTQSFQALSHSVTPSVCSMASQCTYDISNRVNHCCCGALLIARAVGYGTYPFRCRVVNRILARHLMAIMLAIPNGEPRDVSIQHREQRDFAMKPAFFLSKTAAPAVRVSARRALTIITAAMLISGCGGGDSPAPATPAPAPSIFSVVTPVNGDHINIATVSLFAASGRCDSNATGIAISGAVTATAACVNGQWAAQLDFSAVADGAINIVVAESVSSGIAPASIVIALTKDTAAPSLAFQWPAPNTDIVPINVAAFQVRGGCSASNLPVMIGGAVTGSATCTNGSWAATLDFTAAANGNLTITAEQTDVAGNATTQSLTLVKVAACTTSQLDQLAADITNTLSTAVTDADFSFDVKTEDGRELTYNRGASTMSTPYQSASTSKWVSATIILSYLESSANLSSAKPLALNSHPQDFMDATAWPVAQSDTLSAITLRQLLSFTSGLTNEPTCINAALPNGSFSSCVTAIANANVGNGKTPGAEFWYSSNHLQVAGMMVINARNLALGITTSTWQDLVSDFKAKTGLFTNSQYNLPSLNNPRLAGGMTWLGSDYLQFIQAVYNKQVLASTPVAGQTLSYQQQQLSDQIVGASIGSSPIADGVGEDWHYGFGLWLECHAGTFNCSYGVDSYSSPGAYGAYPFMNVTNKFYGIVARQGALGTFRNGYALYSTVQPQVIQWANKSCP